MKQGDAFKLLIAVAIFIAAGVLIAYNLGLFDSKPASNPTTTPSSAPARGQPRTAPGAPTSSLSMAGLPLA